MFKNPLLFFVPVSVVLFLGIYASCDGLAGMKFVNNHIAFLNSFSTEIANSGTSALFSSQASAIPLETPDLKIMQNNTLLGVATPSIVSGKVLGSIFGGGNQKEVVDYVVQSGDTLQSIADAYKISVNTLLWANDLTLSSKIKIGQSLNILPTEGVLHIVRSGDTISGISQTYKSQIDNIVSYNDLGSQSDIYIGDILIVPGGVMPKKATPVAKPAQIPMASNYFIFPTQGTITQGLHYYNAIDIANKCGTPVYAAAAGTVQRAVGNGGWNSGMGNHITILHGNGTVTYYGHLSSVLVKPGDKVNVGDRIGLIGNTGKVIGVTGCHLHFQVVGAKNPLASYRVGSKISYK